MDLPAEIAGFIGASDLIPVDGGQSGARVFRIDGKGLYLKHGQRPCAGLVADEIARLRWLERRVPCARIVASSESAEDAWLLTEALPGVTAGRYLSRDRNRAATVGEAVAEFMSRLHALPVVDCPFDSSLAAWLPVVRGLVADGRIDTEDFDDEHSGWSAERVLAKVEALAGHEQGRVVVHGDLSLGNIVLDERGRVIGCLDVGRLGVGDPYRDIFIAWRDLGGFGDDAPRAFLNALGSVDLDEDRRELHRALDELF